jgi:CRP/FNR family transcriptional regulator
MPGRAAILAALRQTPIFSALDDAALRQLAADCRTRRVARGQVIFSPLQPAERFFLILEGRVKVHKLSPRGDEQILHLYGPGATFAEAAVLAGGTYPARAEATEPAVLLAVPRSAVERAAARSPSVALGMLAGLSAKLHEFALLIETLSLTDAPARVASALLAEATRAGRTSFRLRQTKRHLAARLGIAPETLSRALARFKKAGLVRVDGPRISILDPNGLRIAAGAAGE